MLKLLLTNLWSRLFDRWHYRRPIFMGSDWRLKHLASEHTEEDY